MSVTVITITIEDPAPAEHFGEGVALYSVTTKVDESIQSEHFSRSQSGPLWIDPTRAETDADVIEYVGALIVGRGALPVEA